jgi:outer membrane receptor for monomeric catechols
VSRFSVPLSETPQAITVIPAEQLGTVGIHKAAAM